MTANFINAFRNLQVHERGQALQTLTAQLSPYEWRALHAVTSSRTFQFDVIGSLPIELVAQIFGPLDPATPYRLQCVSRRWRDVLRSLHVLKGSLGHWYQGTVNLQDADYALCTRKARNIHAFRTGKPSHIYRITPNSPIPNFKLVGHSLVWQHVISGEISPSRSACVLDLDTWHLRVLGGEAREQIMNVFASSEIVVLTTFANICYVHELQGTRGCKKFRVPNKSYFRNVACRWRTVACVATLDNHTSVYIWEYDSQRGRSFEIRHEPGTIFLDSDPTRLNSHVLAPLIQPRTQTIIIFADASRATTRSYDQRHLSFSRYTYSGDCISTYHPSLPGISTVLEFEPQTVNSFVPVDYKESIFTIFMRQRIDTDKKASLLIRFNEEDNDLSVWQGSQVQDKQGSWWDSMAWWGDTCYGSLRGAEQQDVVAHLGTSDAKRYVPIVSYSTDFPRAYPWIGINSHIAMNEKYIVRNTVSNFYIVCFDDDDKGKWPKKSGSFFDMWELEVLVTAES